MNPINPSTTFALHRRWQHHRMHIRCGLSPHQAWRIAAYLQLGDQLADRGHACPLQLQLRMLQTLLSTANDAQLPLVWRQCCLQAAHAPLDWLREVLGVHDPLALQAVECACERARRQLPQMSE